MGHLEGVITRYCEIHFYFSVDLLIFSGRARNDFSFDDF